MGVDTVVTGSPLYSLHSTAGLAQELERTQGLSDVAASVWTFAVRIDKLPVVLGALAGLPLAIWLAPRRALVPLAALIVLVGVFVAEGALGASVIDRYMMGAATILLLFCAVSLGGWAMLQAGSALRRVWMGAAAALLVYGVISAVNTLSLSSLRTTLAYHEDFHKGLVLALHDPRVKAQLRRCPLLSLPDNKLIPDARWILGSFGQHDIVARSQARADAAKGVPTLEDRIRRGSARSIRSAAPVSTRRSSTSATTRAIRFRSPDSGACTRAATTRSMRTAEAGIQAGMRGGSERAVSASPRNVLLGRPSAWLGLAAVLAGGLALRLWGIGGGLPYAYNIDEGTHFVPKAIEMFEAGHGLNPHYFANPPAFTYLLHVVLAVWFGGGAGVLRRHRHIRARSTSWPGPRPRLSDHVALWLLYPGGRSAVRRGVGLLAAALEAVAFSPSSTPHLALNDVPTLAPLTLSLLGTAGVLRKGRLIDYLLAGIGLGLACASKYTAGIVLVPLIAASAARYLEQERQARRGAAQPGARDPGARGGWAGALFCQRAFRACSAGSLSRSRPRSASASQASER